MSLEKPQYWEDVISGPKITYQVAHYKGVQSQPLKDEPAASRYPGAVLHHEKDPALVTFYFDSAGEMRIRHEYYCDGVLHRDGDRPAVIDFDAENRRAGMRMEFYIQGKLHRKDGPAVGVYSWIDKEIQVKNAGFYCDGEKVCDQPTCQRGKVLCATKYAHLRKILLRLG